MMAVDKDNCNMSNGTLNLNSFATCVFAEMHE